MPSISDLVGHTKSTSDLSSRPIRIPYNESQAIPQGKSFRLKFPRSQNNEFIDMRSIYLKYNISIRNDDPLVVDPDLIRVTKHSDGTDVLVHNKSILGLDFNGSASIFSRIIVRSASTVLYDLQHSDMIMCWLSNIFTSGNDSKTDLFFGGRTYQDPDMYNDNISHNFVNNRAYMHKITPKGTILNDDFLLPADERMKEDLEVEFFLKTASECFVSMPYPNSVQNSQYTSQDQLNMEKVSFSLVNTEIVCKYIHSPSVSNYFSTSGWQHSVETYTHLFANVSTPQSIVRYGSAHSSLSKIITFLRDGNIDLTSAHQRDKLSSFYPGNAIEDYQLYINNTPYHESPITKNELAKSWKIFKSAYPGVDTSKYYDFDYMGHKFAIVHNLNSTPTQFQDSVISGLKSINLNVDTYMKLNIGPTSSNLRCDSFLINDSVLYITPQGTLRIKH